MITYAPLFNAAEETDENFLNDRLYWAFFNGLGTAADLPHDSAEIEEHLEERRGKVPFLNGGLFEMQEYDQSNAVHIPNTEFAKILNLFERYNFTVTESTPLDIEVAVDPEMLGQVFEELVTGRHDTGSYYTPRPVVSFMCRESLKICLRNKTDETSECLQACSLMMATRRKSGTQNRSCRCSKRFAFVTQRVGVVPICSE